MPVPADHDIIFRECQLAFEAVNKFSASMFFHFRDAMNAKLTRKANQGYRGWDNEDKVSDERLWQMLREHAERGAGQEVDVANFAMMLWWRSLQRDVTNSQADIFS